MAANPKVETAFGGCPHDCPDTCAMVFDIEDGKVVGVRGNKEHPMTRGGLCVKLKDYDVLECKSSHTISGNRQDCRRFDE